MKQFKKISLIVLVILVLALTVTACDTADTPEDTEDVEDLDTPETPEDTEDAEDAEDTEDEGMYKDGVYTGEGEKREYGYELAEVTIEDGEIADIVLKRMTADDEEVDYDEWTGEDDKPNLKQFKDDMAEDMLSEQSYDVDVIATATETSEGWKDAVKEALDKAK